MPYIKKERREDLIIPERFIDPVKGYPQTPGELNYEFTGAIVNYIDERGLNYQTINDILGALEGAKLEFYRRIVVPYEDNKIKENGDVYEFEE